MTTTAVSILEQAQRQEWLFDIDWTPYIVQNWSEGHWVNSSYSFYDALLTYDVALMTFEEDCQRYPVVRLARVSRYLIEGETVITEICKCRISQQ